MQITIQLSTPGPVRDGLITGLFSSTSYDISGSSLAADVTLNPGSNLASLGNFHPLPVQLGSTLILSANISAGGNAYGSEGAASGNAGINLDLHFFEADGVTPVAVAETPEPATFAFMGLGLAGMMLGLRFRRR